MSESSSFHRTGSTHTPADVPFHYIDLAAYVVRRDGELVWFDDSTAEILAPLSKAPGFIGFIVPVTPEMSIFVESLKNDRMGDEISVVTQDAYAYVSTTGVMPNYRLWDRRVLNEGGVTIFVVPPQATLFVCPLGTYAEMSTLLWHFCGQLPADDDEG